MKTMMLIICLAFAPQVWAGSNHKKELSDMLRRELGPVVHSMNDFSTSDAVMGDSSYFYFRRIFLRLSGIVGFDIPELVDFKVVPEVELVWDRQLPKGWGDYKPRPAAARL